MKDNKFRFLLYRLNIVDELGLFSFDVAKRIRNDDQIIDVINNGTEEKFDYTKEKPKTICKWSIREFTNYGVIDNRGPIVSVVIAKSVLQKEGQVVTSDKIITATSSSSPPLAETAVIFFDLSRHIAAVEYNSAFANNKFWKVAIISIMLKSAYSLGLTSSIQLEEIPEKHEIIKLFKSFDRLTRLKVHLRIPNPELSRYTEKLFIDLQEGGIRDYVQDMKNPNGLSVESEARPFASASLAQAGYKEGEVLFEGFKDGKHTTVKSTEEAVRGSIDSLKSFVRGISANAKTKEAQNVLTAIAEEIDRLHPREQE